MEAKSFYSILSSDILTKLTPPTPITPASSASSTSQQMEKYKNARNKSPGPAAAAAANNSGRLKRYEGYEKDLHRILSKTSAKGATPSAARGGGISSDAMAPLQPVKYAYPKSTIVTLSIDIPPL